MDMSNATAAGPSYGLLDIIMGNVPQEGKAEGTEFEPMLNLIKALEKKKDEDSTADSRTDQETKLGTNSVDYRFVNMPGMNAVMSTPENQTLLNWAEAQGMSPTRAQATLLLATVKAQAKQESAKAMALPPGMQVMQPKEQEVWNKYLAANPSAPSPTLDSIGEMDAQQNLTADQLLEMRSGKNQAITQGNLKNAIPEGLFVKEALMNQQSMAKPAEKLMSTQDYLQIQQQMNSPAQPKQTSLGEAKEKASVADAESNAPSVKNVAVTGGALGASVANLASKSFQQSADDGAMGGDKKSSEKEQSTAKTDKVNAKDVPIEFPMSTNMDTGLKVAAGTVLSKDIFLTGMKPQELRTNLLDEVAQSVRTQAVKGGGEMKLIIHPDNLGELKLKVSTRDSKVEVSVTADNDQVAGILRKSADDLRTALGEQNLALAKFDVKVADNTTNAMSNSHNGNMDNFLSQQNQLAQDFRQGMNEQSRGGFAQEFSGGRNSLAASDIKSASKQKAVAPRIKSSTNRLDVVA